MNFVILAATLFVGFQSSPFNTYSVHLPRVTMSGGCDVKDLNQFGNRVYRFRDASMWPFDQPLSLRNGEAVERNPDGSIEWEARFSDPRVVDLGKNPAVLLEIGAVHLGGTGSIDYFLVVRCTPKTMEVLFEASGPITTTAYSIKDGLKIGHYAWAPTDCHACPSREVTERYSWQDNRNRFVLIDRSERKIER
jgi:hypothetical protein